MCLVYCVVLHPVNNLRIEHTAPKRNYWLLKARCLLSYHLMTTRQLLCNAKDATEIVRIAHCTDCHRKAQGRAVLPT